jgi:hypothetical protein
MACYLPLLVFVYKLLYIPKIKRDTHSNKLLRKYGNFFIGPKVSFGKRNGVGHGAISLPQGSF